MKRPVRVTLLLLGLALSLVALGQRSSLQAWASGVGVRGAKLVGAAAPELPRGLARVDGGPEVRLAALRGRVILLHFWTFGCSNCKAMLPHYADWDARLTARGLAVVGVHTPELDFEHDRARLKAFVAERAIRWPVVVDDEMAAWERFAVDAWPTIVLVDRRGVVRAVHVGDDRARAIEADLAKLLAEAAH